MDVSINTIWIHTIYTYFSVKVGNCYNSSVCNGGWCVPSESVMHSNATMEGNSNANETMENPGMTPGGNQSENGTCNCPPGWTGRLCESE